MPTEQQIHPDHLLPWFVNETLSEDERKQVALHLEDCEHCKKEIVLLQKMRNQVKDLPTHSPGELGLNRLLQDIRNEKVTQVPQQLHSGWWRTGLAIAASLIIFVQAGLLLDAWYLSQPVVPLAGPQHQGPILQISFTPTATEAQIRKAITGIDGTFIDGPSHLGIYRVHLEQQPTDQQEIENLIRQLRQQTDIINHVARD